MISQNSPELYPCFSQVPSWGLSVGGFESHTRFRRSGCCSAVSWIAEFDLQSMKYLEEVCKVKINNQLHCVIVKTVNIIVIDGAGKSR